ncbi:unnamed protein product [Phytophthora fragariaefolia]|uniref:Unnamed protein product n=1 Tax=Phytophthora fragariaefolia TaxID=1490495 RepID=A0A9W6XFM7_9STRA|nr:unnamed protein product [Phytophthora fragariaefolia]
MSFLCLWSKPLIRQFEGWRACGLVAARNPPPPAAAAHDVDFRHLWRQLRAAGWTSKRPTGIQTEWTHASPKGANVLVGERAVVEYAFQSGLLVEGEEDLAEAVEDDGDEHVGEGGGRDEHGGEEGEGSVDDEATVRPSQIDTSVLLSQNTIEQMFGASDESEAELLQTAVTRAFGLSLKDLQGDEEQRDAAACLHMLSEASGLESEGEDERARSSEYEEFSSDDSDSVGICDNDRDSEGDEFDEEGDELSDSDTAEMDQAFLASRHVGGDELQSKAALRGRKAALQSMEWTPVSAEFETDTPSYPGLGAEEARPVRELLDVWRSPLLTLFYFAPKFLWVSIARETNRYWLQQVNKRVERMAARQTGRPRKTAAQIARRLKATQAYGAHEILHVVGLLVARMLCPQKRRFAAHWSMVEHGAIPAGLFGRYMTRDRCQNIFRDLHFVDNTVDHGRDKLWNLCPVVDTIQERFLAGWSLPAVFSFDEGVLPTTSKRNTTRMFMSDKRHRYVSKLFMLCDAKTAYCHIYVGKRNNVDGGDNGIDFKTGAAAVLRNLKAVFTPQTRHNWHAVVIDRLHFHSSRRGAAEGERSRGWNDHDESLGVQQEYQVR